MIDKPQTNPGATPTQSPKPMSAGGAGSSAGTTGAAGTGGAPGTGSEFAPGSPSSSPSSHASSPSAAASAPSSSSSSSTTAGGSGTGMGAGTGAGLGAGPGATRDAGSGRPDYSSSAASDPDFGGTEVSLNSLPIGDAMHEMVDICRQCVREHPLASVAAALLVGMALGRR